MWFCWCHEVSLPSAIQSLCTQTVLSVRLWVWKWDFEQCLILTEDVMVVCVQACVCAVKAVLFYLKYDSSHKQKNPGWPGWSIIAELTHYTSRAYCWQFAIPLCQSPDSICSSQEAPDHPLTYPTAKPQMSWCLGKLKPEMVEAG